MLAMNAQQKKHIKIIKKWIRRCTPTPAPVDPSSSPPPTTLALSPTPTPTPVDNKSFMDGLLGLLRIKIKKGINLAVRDARRGTSDPYVVVKMGKKQRLRTSVIKQDLNPEWNDDLTLSVSDPTIPIRLKVYDRDTFSLDDKMGHAEFSIKPFIESLKIESKEDLPSGTVLSTEEPSQSNCLSKESCVMWQDGKLVQDMCLKLQNVECGEVELQLLWIDLKG